MKVYILWKNYFNGCDNFESIVDIYSSKEDANRRCFEMESDRSNQDYGFFVEERNVIE